MIIYIKNERGVAYPLFIQENDTVEEIWKELRVCTSISDRAIIGKILISPDGRKLKPDDRLNEAGITHFDVIKLVNENLVKSSLSSF